MSKQQTAVEWLVEQMKYDFISYPDEIIEQAKEMEKEQIENAYLAGYEDWGNDNRTNVYYTETYEKI